VSNRRTLMAAAAIVLAAVAGIGVYVYASNADSRAQKNAQFVDAFVATSDIAKGTTGQEAVQAGLITTEKVARSSVPPSVIASENDLTDKVAASRIDAKQFITAQTFVSSDEGVGGAFAQAIASQNLVAVTVNMDVERGVANAIEPGDRVDIAQSVVDDAGNATTTYLMRGVKVLAVGVATVPQAAVTPTADATGATTPVVQSGLLTFEVTSEDALQVISANTGQAKPYLVLLPPKLSSGSGGTATPASGTR
jgi:Flp pilus assembly protein CpaB